MARNFKRVVHTISYRHLGDDVYHAGFLFLRGTVAGRRKIWWAEIWSFSLAGTDWHALFPEGLLVESCHIVRDRATRVPKYSGKDEVRAEMLKIAFQRRLAAVSKLPGFGLLWQATIRGTTTEAGIKVKTVSAKLETDPAVSDVFADRNLGCTRCPECGMTRCSVECLGVS